MGPAWYLKSFCDHSYQNLGSINAKNFAYLDPRCWGPSWYLKRRFYIHTWSGRLPERATSNSVAAKASGHKFLDPLNKYKIGGNSLYTGEWVIQPYEMAVQLWGYVVLIDTTCVSWFPNTPRNELLDFLTLTRSKIIQGQGRDVVRQSSVVKCTGQGIFFSTFLTIMWIIGTRIRKSGLVRKLRAGFFNLISYRAL
jgi:hypothetical protein